MARRKNRVRDISPEEFDAWSASIDSFKACSKAADEEGGPRLSFVPQPKRLGLEILPDEVDAAPDQPTSPATLHAVPFAPEPSRKVGGWSASRQHLFVGTLAETGSVHLAAKSAGLSARSAYGLRIRSAAFARAWDAAQQLAVGRLSALVFDRAINGRVEQIWCGDELVGEKRVPSDRPLTWLLARLDPARFAAPWERRSGDQSDPQADVQAAFPALMAALTDVPVD
jgi:hypothetical protein